MPTTVNELREHLELCLQQHGVVILPPTDAVTSAQLLNRLAIRPQTTILDPWYNRGKGGVRDDYFEHLLTIVDSIKGNTGHLFFWGFPEIVAQFIGKVETPLEFVTWLTWYYKNNPSVIRGWRSSQQACLHYATSDAKMYPQNFFNDEQRERYESGRMRFVPGPTSVIEESLLVGFVGKKEQTGHPSQKPERVYERLVMMTTMEGDLVFDPMAGSGTTGAVCKSLRRAAILSDESEEFTVLMENRLGVPRIAIDDVSLSLQAAVA